MSAKPGWCAECGRQLLCVAVKGLEVEDPPTRCYECELREKAEKVAAVLMEEDKGFGFDGPG